MAKGIHTELTFETAIGISLLEDGGYVKGHSIDFDADQARVFDTISSIADAIDKLYSGIADGTI